MSELAAVLRDAAAELRRLRVPFAVVGGLAVSVRGTPRFTGDADLAVAVTSDREAQAVAREFLARGYRLLAQLEHRDTGRLATMRLVSPTSQAPTTFVVDLLFASAGIEADVVRDAEVAEVFPGVIVPVAQRGHLIAMKVLSASDKRPLDRGDVLELLRRASSEDLQLADTALDAIVAAGTPRGRDLRAEFANYRRLAALPDDPTFIPRAVPPAPPP